MTAVDEVQPASEAAAAPSTSAMDATAPATPTILAKVATALGWTQGQVWTVLLGLTVAIPASIFGLGPTLGNAPVDLAASAPTLQDPAGGVAAGPTATTPPGSGQQPSTPSTPAPDGSALADAGSFDVGSVASPIAPSGMTTPVTPGTSAPIGSTAPPAPSSSPGAPPVVDAPDPPSGPGSDPDTTEPEAPVPTDPEVPPPPVVAPPGAIGGTDRVATVDGPGTVRGVAAAGPAIAAALDLGADAPGHLVLLDDSGEVVDDVTLEAGGTSYGSPTGVVTRRRSVLVATARPAAVLRVDRAGTVRRLATLPNLPLCTPFNDAAGCQPVVPDGPPRPRHLTANDVGDVFVADPGQGCILRIASGAGTAEPWLCDQLFAVAPTSPTSGIVGVAAAPDHLVVSVADGLDGGDSVSVIAVNEDGTPGVRTKVAGAPPDGGVGGAVVLPDGRAVVALTKANALLVVTADGATGFLRSPTGVTGPFDVEVQGDDLLVAHAAEGAAAAISALPVTEI